MKCVKKRKGREMVRGNGEIEMQNGFEREKERAQPGSQKHVPHECVACGVTMPNQRCKQERQGSRDPKKCSNKLDLRMRERGKNTREGEGPRT